MNTNTTAQSAGTAGEDATVSVAVESDECPASGAATTVQPVVRIREEHNISRRDIDPDALKVLYRLARNEYTAYLVGGGVRDLLLGRKPKDFDISTNAKPEQIRALFRNCILIGRRFRLAHIRYGDKIIETSTFRRTPEAAGDPTDPDADLFQRDDNLFGSPQEDALRRDFTVNGLFYDIESFSIIDYVGGMEDLAARRIRSIGDPCIRFREDPVRMVRAIRFASRLDFTLDPDTEDAIHKHGSELTKASPARLLEEITRLFAFAAGEKAVRLLRSTGLLAVILPEVDACLESDKIDHDLFWRRLQALDQGDTVLPDATPALIFATLLLDALKLHLGREWSFEETPKLKFDKVHAFLEPMAQRLRFPRKLVDRIVHMYLSLNRFCEHGNRGKRGSISNFVTQESFHESLALAEIILSSESGSQLRLNHWRDMLAERLFGQEPFQPSGGERRHGNSNNNNGHNGGNNNNGARRPAEEAEEAGPRLSRSARRRRNKRLRRIHGGEAGEAVAPKAVEDVQAEQAAVAPAEPVAPVAESAPEKAERSRNGRRGGRGRKKDAEPADNAKPAAAAEAVEETPTQPLTAAAFYNVPIPEPEPEPEKKKRGRKTKDRAQKDKAAAEAKTSGEAEKTPERPKPPAMDKADEADTPLHWLDEI